MKNILKLISSAFIIGLIPFSMVAGQEKKNEQKIKIVVSDGSGTKVIIDTVLNNGTLKDSITLKNGKVIYIGPHNDKTSFRTNDNPGNVTVTVSSDGEKTKKEFNEITVVSSDTESFQDADNDSKIYVYNNSKGSDVHQNIMKWSDENGKESDAERTKYVISKDGMVISVEGSDYKKVKELVKDIESKLDIKK